jgi:hypothetical protein
MVELEHEIQRRHVSSRPAANSAVRATTGGRERKRPVWPWAAAERGGETCGSSDVGVQGLAVVGGEDSVCRSPLRPRRCVQGCALGGQQQLEDCGGVRSATMPSNSASVALAGSLPGLPAVQTASASGWFA